MAISKALRLLASNFYFSYKLLLYYVVCAIILILGFEFILVPTFSPIWQEIQIQNINDLSVEVFRRYVAYDAELPLTLEKLRDALMELSKYLANNRFVLGMFITALVIYYFIASFIFNFKNVAICDYIQKKMTYKMNYSFGSLLIKNFKKSLKYSLISVLVISVFNALAIPFLTYLSLFIFEYSGFFAMFFVILSIFAVYSVLFSLTALCLPEVCNNDSVVKGYIKGVKLSVKHFSKIFSLSILLWLFIFFINAIITTFTFGAGLIFTLPMSVLAIIISQIVLYYGAYNMPFYISAKEVAHIDLNENPLEATLDNYEAEE